MKRVSKILTFVILTVLCISLLAVFSVASSASVGVEYLAEDGSTVIGERESYTTLSDAFWAAEAHIKSYNDNEENTVKIGKVLVTLDSDYTVGKNSAESITSFAFKYDLDLNGKTLTIANGAQYFAGFSSVSEFRIVGNGTVNLEGSSVLANPTGGVFAIVGEKNITLNNNSSKQPITYNPYSTVSLENVTVNQNTNNTLFSLGSTMKSSAMTLKNVTVNASVVNNASVIIVSQKDVLNLENVKINGGSSPELISVKNTAELVINSSDINTTLMGVVLYDKAKLTMTSSTLITEFDQGITAYGENKVDIVDSYLKTGSNAFVSTAMPVDSSASEAEKDIPISLFNIKDTTVYSGGSVFAGASHFNVDGGYFWWNKDGGKTLFFRTEEYSESDEGVKRGVLIHYGTAFSNTIGDSNAKGGYAYTFAKHTVGEEELDTTLVINDNYRCPYIVDTVGSPRDGAIAWIDPITYDNPGDAISDVPKLGIVELAYNTRLDKTNGFYRHYFATTHIADNSTVFQKRFYFAGESNRYGTGPEAKYALQNFDFITIDFDIATDSSYPEDLAISIFPIAKGSPSSATDDAIVIRKNSDGQYALYRNENKSSKTYTEIEGAVLSSVPGAWNHITFLFAIEHADGVDKDGNGFEDIKSSSKAYIYVDGNLVGNIMPFVKYSDPEERDEAKIAENATFSVTTHIESLQISLPNNKTFVKGQSYLIDNLRTVSYYKGYEGGFNTAGGSFVAPTDLTELPESVYQSDYEYPITSPEASVGDVAYDSFDDAYAAAKDDDIISIYSDITGVSIDKKIGGVNTNGNVFSFVSEKWGAKDEDGVLKFYYQYEPSYVQFFDLQGNLAYSDFLANGSGAVYGKGDMLNAYAQKDGAYYVFAGWSSTVGGEILESLTVSGDETRFYANYDYSTRVACVTVDNISGKVLKIYTESDDFDISSVALEIDSNTSIRLLKDIDMKSAVSFASNLQNIGIDLNGYTLRSVDKSAIFKAGGGSDIHFYSSREGGVIMNGYIGMGLITAKTGDTISFGAYGSYSGDNLTVQMSSFNYFNEGYTLNLNGGTYVRSQNWHSGMFLIGEGTTVNINDAILYTGSDAPIYFVFGDSGGAANAGASVNVKNSILLERVDNKSASDLVASFGANCSNCIVYIENSILAPDVDYASYLNTNKVILGENVGFTQKLNQDYQNYALADKIITEILDTPINPTEDNSELIITVPIAKYNANQQAGSCEYLGYGDNAEYKVTVSTRTKVASEEDIVYRIIDALGDEQKAYSFSGMFDLASVKDGSTVKLNKDISLKSTSVLSGNKTVNIDLNGHTVFLDSSAISPLDLFRVSDASALNIYSSVSGGKIVNAVTNKSSSYFGQSKAVVSLAGDGARLNIGAVNGNSAENISIYTGVLVSATSSSSISINGGSYYKNSDTQSAYISISGGSTAATLNDALIVVTDNVSAANASLISVSGDEASGKISQVNVNNCSLIYAGEDKNNAYLVSTLSKGSSVSVSGSGIAMRADIKSVVELLGYGTLYLANDNKLSCVIDGTVSLDEFKTVSNVEPVPYSYALSYNKYDNSADSQYDFGETVASGEFGYGIVDIEINENTTYLVSEKGLISAFTTALDLSNVSDGATVILYKDIELSGSLVIDTVKTVYIDLAGHTITNASGAHTFSITAAGELYLYSSVAGAKVVSTAAGAIVSLDSSYAAAYLGAYGENSGDNLTCEGMYLLCAGENATAEAPAKDVIFSLDGGIYLKTLAASTNPDYIFDVREFADTTIDISNATVAAKGSFNTNKGYIFNVTNGNTEIGISNSNILYMGTGSLGTRPMLFNKLASGSVCEISDSVLYVNMRVASGDAGCVTLGANCLVGYSTTALNSTVAVKDGYSWSTTISVEVTVEEVGFTATFKKGTVEDNIE